MTNPVQTIGADHAAPPRRIEIMFANTARNSPGMNQCFPGADAEMTRRRLSLEPHQHEIAGRNIRRHDRREYSARNVIVERGDKFAIRVARIAATVDRCDANLCADVNEKAGTVECMAGAPPLVPEWRTERSAGSVDNGIGCNHMPPVVLTVEPNGTYGSPPNRATLPWRWQSASRLRQPGVAV